MKEGLAREHFAEGPLHFELALSALIRELSLSAALQGVPHLAFLLYAVWDSRMLLGTCKK